MAYTTLDVVPGFISNPTPYSTGLRWRQGNLVRWHEGILLPIGGWTKFTTTTFEGGARALFSWRKNDFLPQSVVGTLTKLYAYDNGSWYDITPTGLTAGYADTNRSAGQLATTWSFANFGQQLVAVQDRDGRLLNWANNPSNPATVVSAAPTSLIGTHVTPERHVFAVGAGGDKRRIDWCSAEDLNTWTPGPTNSAGYLVLTTNETIKSWVQFKNLVIVLTESEVHAIRYVGYPYFYGVEKVSSGGGVMGLHSVVALDDKVVWMGPSNFYVFDGVLRHLPCAVYDTVFGDINVEQREKIYASRNKQFNEVWWFYPGSGSTSNSKYVVWNYAMNIWYTGDLNRVAMEDSTIFDNPLALTSEGVLYKHEDGWTDNGNKIGQGRWVKSGMMSISEGNKVVFVRGAIPDRDPSRALGIRLHMSEWPEGGHVQSSRLQAASPKMDFRISGRHIQLELVGLEDKNWQFGNLRLDVVPAGGR